MKDGIDAKFWLHPVRVAYNDGFDAKTLRNAPVIPSALAACIGKNWTKTFPSMDCSPALATRAMSTPLQHDAAQSLHNRH